MGFTINDEVPATILMSDGSEVEILKVGDTIVWEKPWFATGTFTPSSSAKTPIILGFKPTHIAYAPSSTSGKVYVNVYNSDLTTTNKCRNMGTSTYPTNYNTGTTTAGRIYSLDDYGFTVNAVASTNVQSFNYFAIRDIITSKTASGTYTSSSSSQKVINCGFNPKQIVLMTNAGGGSMCIYDANVSTTQVRYGSNVPSTYSSLYNLRLTTANLIYSITSTGFIANKTTSNNQTMKWFAIG